MSTHTVNVVDIGNQISYTVSNLQKGATYYFAATAYDKYGNESRSSEVVTYKVPESRSHLPPEAIIFTPSGNVTISKGEAILFSGSGTDPDNLNLTYHWNFGDPAISEVAMKNPGNVIFNNAGNYPVTFTVTNSKGLSASDTRLITVSDPATPSLIPQSNWSLVYVNSEELVAEDGRGMNAFDGKSGTIWHTEWKNSRPTHPHEIQIDLGAVYELESFRYLPRQDGFPHGRIKNYAFYVSDNTSDWGNAVAFGTFADSATEKSVVFNSLATGRYIRLVALSEVAGREYASMAEINVTGILSSNELSNRSSINSNSDYSNHFIEMNEIYVNHNWQRVEFLGRFINPVVIAKPFSLNDPESAVIRIMNVDETGFDIRIQAWENSDDTHDYETVTYIAIEKGLYVLPGKIMMEAGTFQADTKNFLFNPFVDSFHQIPVVLASVTSANKKNPMNGRINNISRDGFEYRLKQNESIYLDDFGETVSYIACEPFSGVLNGTAIEVGTTGPIVIDDFHYISYVEPFLTAPHFLADIQTDNDPHMVNVRYRNKDRNGVEVWISREKTNNTEKNHISENVGFMIISGQ